MSQPYRSDRATGQKVELPSSRSHSTQDKSCSSAPVCRFCRKKGHILSDCFKLKQRHQGQNDSKPTDSISKSCNLPSNVNDVRGTILEEKSTSDSVMQSFEPFIHNGFVPLSSDLTNSNPGKILSDCFKLKQRRQGQNDSKPTDSISKSSNLPSNVNDVRGTILEEKSTSDSVMQSFEPFIYNGSVPLSSDLTNSNPGKILWDTGASQSHIYDECTVLYIKAITE